MIWEVSIKSRKVQSSTGRYIVIGLVVSGLIISVGLILFYVFICGIPRTTTDIETFKGRGSLPQADGRDCYGYMLGFPESTEKIQVKSFYSRIRTGLTYEEGEICLVYQTSKGEYQREKARISEIVMGNEEVKRSPILVSEGMKYPGYILSLTYECCEYVMFNDEEQQIICVYLQAKNWADNNIPDEYKMDISSITQKIQKGYSIYFDDDYNMLEPITF